MSTRRSPDNSLSLLRRIVHNLVRRPLPTGQITHDVLRAEGLGRARANPDALVGILSPGAEAFNQLSEIIFRSNPRGCYVLLDGSGLMGWDVFCPCS